MQLWRGLSLPAGHVIPGHERAGEELITDVLRVEDEQLSFDYRGVCGYGSTFEYAG